MRRRRELRRDPREHGHRGLRRAIELHRNALEALAEALLEQETLEGNEALSILRTHGVSMEDALRRRVVG